MANMVDWPVAEALSDLEEVDEGSASYKRNMLAQVHQEFVLAGAYHGWMYIGNSFIAEGRLSPNLRSCWSLVGSREIG
jgi:hypothetical protein